MGAVVEHLGRSDGGGDSGSAAVDAEPRGRWGARSRARFAAFAWAALAYTVAVILWGAYVRATGSGAGCGSHWPTCNGEVLPRPERLETMIELAHRVTSGVAGIVSVVLAVWAFFAFPAGNVVRRAAVASFALMMGEALLGAGLVLFELVANDASMARAASMSLHLVNTFALLAAMTCTACWASGREPPRPGGAQGIGKLLATGAVGIGLVGVTGAVTALGDTLLQTRGGGDALRATIEPATRLLLSLRVVHPVLAVLVALYLVALRGPLATLRPSAEVRRWANAMAALAGAQLLLGVVNVVLAAPVWMQLVHLLVADLVWIAYVMLTAAALAAPAPSRSVA